MSESTPPLSNTETSHESQGRLARTVKWLGYEAIRLGRYLPKPHQIQPPKKETDQKKRDQTVSAETIPTESKTRIAPIAISRNYTLGLPNSRTVVKVAELVEYPMTEEARKAEERHREVLPVAMAARRERRERLRREAKARAQAAKQINRDRKDSNDA